ncbi:hypothetical protein [Halorientalis salina]|uniref:hypothetical protein n=1 Tax=Halorientalis salina TaxID=2932266 RepID=UPI0010AC5712|nr:hypothetical protein [Halorientalis salina]
MSSRFHLQAFAVVAAIMLVSSFAFVGFAAAEHRIDVDQQVATSSTNGATMLVPTTVSLYVVGPDPIRGQVEQALVSAFERRDIDVTVVTDLEPTYDRPVLMVGVRDTQLAYNPVTPSATVSLGYEYAADGNVTQFGEDGDSGFDGSLVDDRLLTGQPISHVLDDQNTLFRSGEIRLTDESRGIVSWPGYRAHVTDALGETTIASLFADATLPYEA